MKGTTNFIDGVPLHGALHPAVIGSDCSSEGRGRHWRGCSSETTGSPYIAGYSVTVFKPSCQPGSQHLLAYMEWREEGYGIPDNLFWRNND